jgi:phosphohistidine phosphatase
MRSLLLVRHAKSSWDDFSIPDIDRPLNDRGKRDAPKMAIRLLEKKIPIDAILSSPAKRALKTAEAFSELYGIAQKHILVRDKLYMAGPEDFLEVILKLDDAILHPALFSHNPGITSFANSLGAGVIDDMPTCSIFAVKFDIKKWKDFSAAEKSFWFFDYPKKGS